MPTTRGRNQLDAASGTMPRRVNTNPKRASVLAMRMSIGSVIVTPTPTAGPLIAAITGLVESKIRSVTMPPPSRTIPESDRTSLPPSYPHRHDATDPVLISHSSGTTGMPKGVPHTHRTLMYAQLHRLRYSTGTDMERTLVGLPGAHNAMVATLLYCLLLRTDIKLLSSRRGADVLDAVEEFRPTTVLAFAGTFGEMAAEECVHVAWVQSALRRTPDPVIDWAGILD